MKEDVRRKGKRGSIYLRIIIITVKKKFGLYNLWTDFDKHII